MTINVQKEYLKWKLQHDEMKYTSIVDYSVYTANHELSLFSKNYTIYLAIDYFFFLKKFKQCSTLDVKVLSEEEVFQEANFIWNKISRKNHKIIDTDILSEGLNQLIEIYKLFPKNLVLTIIDIVHDRNLNTPICITYMKCTDGSIQICPITLPFIYFFTSGKGYF